MEREKSRNRGRLRLDVSSPQSISDCVPVPVGVLLLGRSQGSGPLAHKGHSPSALSLDLSRHCHSGCCQHMSLFSLNEAKAVSLQQFLLEADAQPLRATSLPLHQPRCSPHKPHLTLLSSPDQA